jgi:hypothetical protein
MQIYPKTAAQTTYSEKEKAGCKITAGKKELRE